MGDVKHMSAHLPLTRGLITVTVVLWAVSWLGLAFVLLVGGYSLIILLLGPSSFGALGALAIVSVPDLAVWTCGGVAALACLIGIFSLLRGIFTTLVAGDPFIPGNARRLRRIAVLLAGLEIFRHLLSAGVIAAFFGANGKEPDGASINGALWIAIAILIVLAHVFDEGARLREDNRLTI